MDEVEKITSLLKDDSIVSACDMSKWLDSRQAVMDDGGAADLLQRNDVVTEKQVDVARVFGADFFFLTRYSR